MRLSRQEQISIFRAATAPLCMYFKHQRDTGNVLRYFTSFDKQTITLKTYLGFYNAVLLPEILRLRTPTLGYRTTVSLAAFNWVSSTSLRYCNKPVLDLPRGTLIFVVVDVVQKGEE